MKMRTLVLMAACSTLTAGLAFGQADQSGNSDTMSDANAGATIAQPLNISEEESLEFGKITLGSDGSGGAYGGDVTIDCTLADCSDPATCEGSGAENPASMTGFLDLFPVQPTDEEPRRGDFSVTGEDDETIRLNIDDPDATNDGELLLLGQGFVGDMVADTLTVCRQSGTAYSPATAGAGGDYEWTTVIDDTDSTDNAEQADFWLGGTLHVNDNQASGRYVATFDATVSYE